MPPASGRPGRPWRPSPAGALLPAEEDGDLEPQEHVAAVFIKYVELRQHLADVVPADRIAPFPAVGQ